MLTSCHMSGAQVAPGGITWNAGIRGAGKLDGQNRGEKHFLNEVWGWHVSPLLVSTSSLPCWMVEEFVVAEECAPCSSFQAVSICFLSLFSHI